MSGAGYSNWRYSGANELLGYDTVGYEYDPNGNLTRKADGGSVTDYAYDSTNRLASVVGPLHSASYAYDPFGRRVKKDVDGSVTYYLYSDEGLVGEYDSGGGLVKSYGWTPGGIWGTDPVFMKYDGQYYFYHNDRLGTPQEMTDMAAETVWRADYEAFGRAHITVDTLENNLRFPGQYYDEETGLHNNLHRYYDPETGRYVSEDPIGFAGGVNRYVYAVNDPINKIDPLGLQECCPSGGKPTFHSDEYWKCVASKVCYEHFDAYVGGVLAIAVFPGSAWIVIPGEITLAAADALSCRNQATHCD